MPIATEQDQIEVAKRVLTWLFARTEFFRVTGLSLARQLRLIKPLGELAILADLMHRHPNERLVDRSQSSQLLDFCWEELIDSGLLGDLIENLPGGLVLVPLYANFHRNDYRSNRIFKAISDRMNVRGFSAPELPAWQQLDVAIALRDIGIASRWSETDIVRSTWLGQLPEPWSAWQGAAYSITHTVFSLTRLGRYPENLRNPYRAYLSLWLPIWLKFYSSEGQLDLFSELVVAAHCSELRFSEICPFDIIASGQNEDGHIAPPKGASQTLCIGETDSDRIFFLERYHTSLVALLAMVLELKSRAQEG
jgi:hypothetical protein